MFYSVVLGMIIMIIIVYNLRHIFITRILPSESINRIVYKIIKDSEEISNIQSPELALLKSVECQSSLDTLIQVVGGGYHTLDTVCHIDSEKLRNILHFQQTTIMEYINRQKNT